MLRSKGEGSEGTSISMGDSGQGEERAGDEGTSRMV